MRRGLIVALLTVACASGASPGPAAQSKPDVVVGARNGRRPVSVTVGQTVAVRPPLQDRDWRVGFSDDLLELLSPADRLSHPGADGWLFKAVAPGEGQIVLEPLATPDASPNPRSPAQARFVIPVTVLRGRFHPAGTALGRD